MKKSQLKKHIKEQIFSVLNEKKSLLEKELEPTSQEDEEVEDVDVEAPAGGGDISGLQGLLQDALAQAKETGDEKLVQQIGNTLTYFTRAHLIKGGEDKAMMEISRLQELAGLKEYGLEHDHEKVDDEDFDHPAINKKKEVKEEEDPSRSKLRDNFMHSVSEYYNELIYMELSHEDAVNQITNDMNEQIADITA